MRLPSPSGFGFRPIPRLPYRHVPADTLQHIARDFCGRKAATSLTPVRHGPITSFHAIPVTHFMGAAANWRRDMDEALRAALEEDRPVKVRPLARAGGYS